MNFVAKIEVKKEEAKEMERVLKITEGICPDYGYYAVIKTYTAIFANGFKVELIVCNGDSPFVEPTLYNEKGQAMVQPEVVETLIGEYSFEFEGNKYEVTVEESDENSQTTMYPESRKGISLFSSERVEIIGERTVEHEGKVLEQYVYHIIGYQPQNGKPFVSLKPNIIVE